VLKGDHNWFKLCKKNAQIFQNAMQKIMPKNSLAIPRNRKKNENISLSYDDNDHVHSKL